MADKPRILINGKDMFWSLVPLLALIALVAIASGNCSVGLNQDPADSKVPAFDVVTALDADARQMPFPIRRPPTPEGWKPNSGSSDAIEGHRVSTVGWLSASGAYVQLSQTDASEDLLVPYLGGDDTKYGDVGATGTREAGGRQWVTYETAEGKKFWITDFGNVRVGVLSRGPDADIETIAASVATQQPLDA
ncbi:DUF4245 domain-containing protein [Gordonia rubripertincta]|uniref:DUF4245 domain-containing protein n=2 Tax=Gordonia rubripertincta TaxID=36822 RepID=A0AAW4G2P5_GORRU|nr:DUF4245 domain-containing protein [Gordonia rubripertincta]MBM7277426.1 DUF4245 domain-containing protein [Gordonia rubripertincta]MDG6780225.1 DUF4245 domain-containing protein [Gordonia rubripertincta]NKY63512.1 DUF4245 domain-containing protein [Gordonia rubripertincta]QMU20430.1 DUF4245 domain-containing protein [Gordonia rubripertincta]GAB84400.1 hypothetical protein GORBP_039_01110 [Gordonia rubripertincta NBRC 101908]